MKIGRVGCMVLFLELSLFCAILVISTRIREVDKWSSSSTEPDF
jgi:hypothetical protein